MVADIQVSYKVDLNILNHLNKFLHGTSPFAEHELPEKTLELGLIVARLWGLLNMLMLNMLDTASMLKICLDTPQPEAKSQTSTFHYYITRKQLVPFFKEIIKHYMNQEEINILKVEDGLYGNRLRQNLLLSRNLFDYESNLIKAVAKLIRWEFILEDHKTFFTEEEQDQEVFLLSPPPEIIVNKELLARWLDFGMCFIEINNPQQLKVVANAYLDVYSATGEKKYFLRPLQFGGAVKGIFKARMEEFYRIGTGYIQRDIYPFWQDKILAVLISFCGLKRCKEDFTTFFMNQETNFAEKGEFSSARKTLDCQKTLQILKTDELKIKCAELYMAEGDSWLEKNAAAHYVGIADIYLKGFRNCIL